MAYGSTVLHFGIEEIKSALLLHAARQGLISDQQLDWGKNWTIERIELQDGSLGLQLVRKFIG